jgi:D-alanyl-D-alanine carboxypeptidase
MNTQPTPICRSRVPSSFQVWLVLLLLTASHALAQAPGDLAPELRGKIDVAVRQVLAAKGTPSASIAIVQNGRIAYLQAYGDARLDPRASAAPGMRYSIGSISKQFAATAILMLAEQGKLSLDDPVGRFVPDLTRGEDVTIRQVLSHTSGYQDYWPQDFVPRGMSEPVSPDKILDRWARKPLDFDPGTDWQYSNTGYTVAGLIVERVSGQPLFGFLEQHVFAPLGMQSVTNVDQDKLGDNDATGYTRYGLGPLHVAVKEGKGWLFAACELAMTAEDLAKWDVSLIRRTLLKPESYREMESAIVLKNGLASWYGLGVSIGRRFSRRVISHDGGVSGFISYNMVFPDDGAAVVVLTNNDAAYAASDIGQQIAPLLFPQDDNTKEEQQALRIFEDFQKGRIDRTLFSDDGNFYFTDQSLKDLAAGLKRLGKPLSLTQTYRQERGGMTYRVFVVKFKRSSVQIGQRTLPDGKIEQYQVSPSE